jgi:hypothetical protein
MTYEKEIAIAGLSAIGVVTVLSHQDGIIIASVITAIATIAGVFVGRSTLPTAQKA